MIKSEITTLRSELRAMVLVFLWLLTATSVFSQSHHDAKFTHIEDGLTHNNITAIFEDSKGYLWAGARNGLNRYTGLGFDKYEKIEGDSTSCLATYTTSILEDANSDLWIGSENGLSRYIRDLDQFEFFIGLQNPGDSIPFPSSINCMYAKDDTTMYIGAEDGVYVFDVPKRKITDLIFKGDNMNQIIKDSKDRIWFVGHNFYYMDKQGEIHHIHSDTTISPNIAASQLTSIAEDFNGTLWIGSRWNGLFKLNEKNNKPFSFDHYSPTKGKNSLSHNFILALKLDSKGYLWIGTENGGLNKYDIKNDYFHHYKFEPKNEYSINGNSIWSILEDHAGRMWFGTYSKGLQVIDPILNNFTTVSSKSPAGISGDAVRAFAEDSKGNIWIGMDGGGLDFYDAQKNTYTYYDHDPDNPNSLSSDAVLSIAMDQDDNPLIAAWAGGLTHYLVKEKRFVRYKIKSAFNPRNANNIFCIIKDRQNESGFWLSSWVNGLYYFDLASGEFSPISGKEFEKCGLNRAFIHTIKYGKGYDLWIGSLTGLYYLHWDEKKEIYQPTKFEHSEHDSTSISDQSVTALFKDNEDRIWIGTNSGGLNLYLPKSKSFQRFGKSSGLPSNSIQSIVADGSGDLWIGTSKGLSEAKIFKNGESISLSFDNYDRTDGLQGDFFRMEAALRTKSGQLYFGGNDGLNKFFPETFAPNPEKPAVVFTDLKIFNKKVPISYESGGTINKHISQVKEVNLQYDQNVFTIEFLALNYTKSEKNQYAYILEGVDKEWNYVGNKRSATYSNLEPGSYTFRVKASNNDGLWNEDGASIIITATPAWWNTVWFKILSFTLALLFIGLILLQRRHRIEQQKKLLQSKLDEALAEMNERNKGLEMQNKNLSSSIDDTNYIINQAVESGNFKARIDITDKVGEWKSLAESINKLFDSVVIPLNAINDLANEMAKGDLSQDFDEDSKGDILVLKNNFNQALQNLNNLIRHISEAAGTIEMASQEMFETASAMSTSTTDIAMAISEMTNGANTQVMRIDDSSTLVTEIRAASVGVADKSKEINSAAKESVLKSQKGIEMITGMTQGIDNVLKSTKHANSAMSGLTRHSKEISRISNTIAYIAGKTNLLSINAAIQASKAGDAGSQFAVISEEIRTLAETSKKSADEIRLLIESVQEDTSETADLINNIYEDVTKSVEISNQASTVFGEMSSSSEGILSFSEEILVATEDQTTSLGNLVSAIENIAVIAEETAAGTHESSAAANEIATGMNQFKTRTVELRDIALDLKKWVEKFVLKSGQNENKT